MPATYEPIATTTLGSAQTAITFNSISGSYTDLKIVLVGKTTSTSGAMLMTFNNDTGTNYSRTQLYGDGSSAASNRNTSAANISCGTIYSTQNCFFTTDIFSYAGSTNKTALSQMNSDQNGSGVVSRSVGLWRSTSAITRVDLTAPGGDTFVSGTTATLYGIKSA